MRCLKKKKKKLAARDLPGVESGGVDVCRKNKTQKKTWLPGGTLL